MCLKYNPAGFKNTAACGREGVESESLKSRMEKVSNLPINSVARNALWIYPKVVPPRFEGAREIIENTRSYEMPDVKGLPEGADVTIEIYGGAVTLRLDGETRRVYVARFEWVSFPTDEAARTALLSLWETVALLDSVARVEEEAQGWKERQKSENMSAV
jgi:hypothetical protein